MQKNNVECKEWVNVRNAPMDKESKNPDKVFVQKIISKSYWKKNFEEEKLAPDLKELAAANIKSPKGDSSKRKKERLTNVDSTPRLRRTAPEMNEEQRMLKAHARMEKRH